MNLRIRLAVPVLCCALLCTAIAQQPAITPEWINKEGAHVADVHKYQWLEDGSAIIYDQRTHEPQRALERFDPTTGQRKTLFDGAKTFAALKQLGATFKKEIGLPWPDAIDSQGKHAAYEVEDKVFVVDMSTGEAIRLGGDDVVVKSPQFSPNAAMVAFVRANDIYVYDFADETEKRITTDGSKTTLNGTLSWVYWEEVFGRRDIGLWWSPDSTSIAFLQTDESQVPRQPLCRFQAANASCDRTALSQTGTDEPESPHWRH
jgi:hypothetical protein